MSGKCGYDCGVFPTEVQFDPDITGIGVLIGYIAPAGIVVAIVLTYYFLGHRPDLSPYRLCDGSGDPDAASSRPFRPNPVDKVILQFLRKKRRSCSPSYDFTRLQGSHLEQSFIKVVLAMSDLQLVTGFAILVSGYSQLHCGLSCYHWFVVGRLAWFSSLTNLSCLTLLRNYLHKHPAERHWRLALMFAMLVLLVTVIVPSGNYDWDVGTEHPFKSDYAVCYFSTPVSNGVDRYAPMILVVLSISLGFLFRVVKLTQPLSNLLVGRPRQYLSKRARGRLWMLHNWSENLSSPWKLMGKGCYFGALASFLALRVLLDHWSSMFFEVYWLLVSFLYSLVALATTLSVEGDTITTTTDWGGWSFGQVMAVVLLAGPLKITLELIYPAERGRVVGTETISRNQTRASLNFAGDMTRPENSSIFTPDYDYYQGSTSLAVGNIFIMVAEVGLGLYLIVLARFANNILILLTCNPVFLLFSLWSIILGSLKIDLIAWNKRGEKPFGRYLPFLQFLNLALFSAIAALLIYVFPL